MSSRLSFTVRKRPKPYSLLKGDCLHFLKGIPEGSVDLIVTDPPYRVISGGNTTKLYGGGVLEANDGKIFAHNDIKPAEYLPLFWQAMAPSCHLYIMINVLNFEKMLTECRIAGFKLHNILYWKKNTCNPNRWYMKDTEFVLHFRKGKAFPINNLSSKQSFEWDNPRNKLHPTQKPVELMQHYIENSSQTGQTVLDPFMGAGSTGIAAINTGRKFIGIEKDPAYFEIAENRIKEAHKKRLEIENSCTRSH